MRKRCYHEDANTKKLHEPLAIRVGKIMVFLKIIFPDFGTVLEYTEC